jgi:hypothetical protein
VNHPLVGGGCRIGEYGMGSIEEMLAVAEATAERFVSAVASGVEADARALCTEAGWEGGDTRVYGLVRQAQRKGLVLDLFGEPHKLANRAAQQVVLSHPSRSRPLGDVWLLLEDAGDGWLVVGATKLRPHAALFLWKALGGTLSLVDLDRSARGEAWAEAIVASLNEGVVPELPFGSEMLATRLQADGVSIKPLQSVELLAVSRAAVGFQFTTPEDSLGYAVWLVLSLSTREPAVVAANQFLGLERLFTGVEVTWPHEDPDRPGLAIPGYEDPSDPAGARLSLEGVLRSVLVGAGIDPAGLPEGDPRRAAIGELFASLRRIAPRHGELVSDTSLEAAASALQPNPDAPVPLGLPPELQQQLELALESIQQRTPPGAAGSAARTEEAAALMETQGTELVSALFQAIFKDINPQAVALTSLQQSEDADGKPVLRAIVDPAAQLGDVMGGFDEE